MGVFTPLRIENAQSALSSAESSSLITAPFGGVLNERRFNVQRCENKKYTNPCIFCFIFFIFFIFLNFYFIYHLNPLMSESHVPQLRNLVIKCVYLTSVKVNNSIVLFTKSLILFLELADISIINQIH